MVTGYERDYYHAVDVIAAQMKRLADSQEEIVNVAVPALLSALQRIAERPPIETPEQFRARVEAGTTPVSARRWQPWNDGTGKRKWFLARVVGGVTEYHWAKPRPPADLNGALIRYASYETALKAAERLNVKDTT